MLAAHSVAERREGLNYMSNEAQTPSEAGELTSWHTHPCPECDDSAWECEEDRCPGNGQPYECPTCHAETNYLRSFEVARSQPTVGEALIKLHARFIDRAVIIRNQGSWSPASHEPDLEIEVIIYGLPIFRGRTLSEALATVHELIKKRGTITETAERIERPAES